MIVTSQDLESLLQNCSLLALLFPDFLDNLARKTHENGNVKLQDVLRSGKVAVYARSAPRYYFSRDIGHLSISDIGDIRTMSKTRSEDWLFPGERNQATMESAKDEQSISGHFCLVSKPPNMTYGAIAVIRLQIFIFSGHYYVTLLLMGSHGKPGLTRPGQAWTLKASLGSRGKPGLTRHSLASRLTPEEIR